MKTRIINLLFVLGIFLFLLASFTRTVFFPMEINEYENRKAQQLSPVCMQDYLDSTFQDSMEKSLTDQAYFAQNMKEAYNTVVSGYMRKVVSAAARINNDKYIKIGNHYLYGQDHLLSMKQNFDIIKPKLDARIREYNALFKKHLEQAFYLYYIETDMDNRFDTGASNDVYSYLSDKIALSDTHMDEFSVESFEEYDRYFYKTDHHWNADGSYKAYGEVVRMLLSEDEPLLKPIETVSLSGYYGYFSGSKTMDTVTARFGEPFYAHRFAFLPMSVYGNDMRSTGYGNQELFLDGVSEKPLSYANFYGDDWGAVTIDTYQPEKETLLIIGESYDNAILRLLSTHFDRVISIDLRYFETYIGKKFSIEDCLEKYDIDKVMLIGCVDYFTRDEFSLEQ